MKVKKFEDGWRIRFGDVVDKPFCLALRYFNSNGYKHKKGFRLILDINNDRLIRLFGFNEKVINF